MASWATVAKTTAAAPAPAEAPPPSDTERIVVVDTNAIISGLRLENLADRFCTISEVLTEVRDQQSRTYLSTLPYQLQVMEPTEDSVKAVQRFARETGDIHSLSAVDLKLLALAHTLEVAANGTENIREHPVQVRTRQRHKTRPRALPGWGNVANPEDWKVVDEAPEHLLTNAANAGQSRILAAQPLDLMGGDQLGAAPPQPPGPGQGAAPQAAAPAAGGELPALPLPQPAQSEQQQEQGQGQGQQAEAGAGLQGPGDGGAQGQGYPGDQGGDDSGEEEEDDGGWETATKSRNAARRKQRSERRRQEWLQRQAQGQGTGAGAGVAGPAHASVSVAAAPGSQGAEAQPAAGGARPGAGKDVEHGDAEEEEQEEEGESGDVEHSGEGDEEGEEVLELVTDEEEGEEGEQGTDCGASEAGTTTATATGTMTTQGGEEAEVLPNTTSRVFSVTADFAMQNVMLQMGLRLVTRDGKQITRVSRWALRCSACYFVTKEAGRLFCPRCGNMTMDRVEVTVGPGGAEFFGVRKKFILRGTKYSLPKPKSGRQAIKNPILREDVLMARMAGRQRKAKPAAAEGGELDPFAPEYGKETWHAAGGGRAGGRGLNIPLTNWKNNPNEVKTQRKNRRR